MYKTVFWKLLLLTSIFAMPVFAQEAAPGAYPARIKGAPKATVILEVFNDYACPACAEFNLRLKEVERKYPNDLKIIFRHFPLKIAGHGQAPLAAQAVEAAGLQWKFWEMADLILEKQKLWTINASAKVEFLRYAKKLGLDVGIFRADLESNFVKERISADQSRAVSLKIYATPTVFLNGKQLSANDMMSAGELERIIKENISK